MQEGEPQVYLFVFVVVCCYLFSVNKLTIAIKQSCYPYSQIVSLESHVTVLITKIFTYKSISDFISKELQVLLFFSNLQNIHKNMSHFVAVHITFDVTIIPWSQF